MFHEISDKVSIEFGLPVSDKVFSEWKKWADEEVEKRRNLKMNYSS